jgi:acyl-CoA thioesterase FadM
MVLEQEITRDGSGGEEPSTPVVRARVVAVWIGPDGRPMRVPDEVRSGLTESDPSSLASLAGPGAPGD